MSSSSPTGLTVGNKFYFAVADPIIGAELYALQSDVPVGTTTTLSATPLGSIVGTAVAFTATVAPATGSSIPTGTVTFSDGTQPLGKAALNSSGVAAYTTTSLSAGTHSVIASYGGDAGDTVSASTAITITVAPPAPAVKISVAPASIVLGESATLSWSSTNASSCKASGAWSGAEAVKGSLGVTPTAASTLSYTLACTGGGGTANAVATLVTSAPTQSASGGGGGGALDIGELLGLFLMARLTATRRPR